MTHVPYHVIYVSKTPLNNLTEGGLINVIVMLPLDGGKSRILSLSW
jgi:hypothetical protein